ncbi:MAG: efflux RND transporter periplasmic adaptor subunit [bacterium]|nr:efflux RND transporter periplasmic adaptor subunit [bacterium]
MLLKSLGWTLILLGFFANVGLAAESFRQGDYIITQIKLDPGSPEVGENLLTFKLSNVQGQPIESAEIEVEAFMPEMGTMPRMSTKSTAESLGSGQYQAEVILGMAGGWELPIRIQKAGKTLKEFPFALSVGAPGLNYKGAPEGAPPAQVKGHKRGEWVIDALAIDPNPPQVGENLLTFTLNDAAGKPVEQAQIEIEAFMPEMGTMPRMSTTSQAESLGGGKYQAEVILSMGGGWELPIRIQKKGKTLAEFPFALSVGHPDILYKGPDENAPDLPAGPNVYLGKKRMMMIGVELGKAELRHLSKGLSSVARIELDETQVYDVSLKYSGDVEKLFANREGEFIKKGDPLFSIYSPELFEAQEIFLQLHRDSRSSKTDQVLYRSAREKLQLWDFSPEQMAELQKRQRPPRAQVITSPFTGFILKKNLVDGAFAKKGQPLFKIADLTQLWALAEIFEHEAYEVHAGDRAILSLPYQPGYRFEGKVDYLYPFLDPRTRTLKLRIEVGNEDLLLKPGMFADVEIRSDQGMRLSVPRRAVLYSGRHKYVFKTQGQGYFIPQEVETGVSDGEWVEITKGLEAGQMISFSANFLISSEAQLRNALPRFGEPEESK